MDFQYRISGIL